ncbi:MAG: glycosyltransferase family 4 protein [Candidatus Aenigmarchaeota archaeon]|nr:glycosyltransferase family 4 protein [Candidatus Aenigmarchaeota archaeon]
MSRLFVTNRPNYCHKKFAESVGCSFYHVKHFMPENIPLLSLPVNGMLNSFFLGNAEVFFAESVMDYYPVYYKHTGGKKIILIAEDTLFKLGSMNGIRKNYIIKLFRSADGFMAVSDLCKDMILGYAEKPVRVAYPFPHKEFFHVRSDIKSRKILFIGRNDKTKGFPELVDAVKILRKSDPGWELFLIGECSRAVKKEDGIHPLGFVRNIEPYMKSCAYYVHPARFDPCPATVFEAMNAGMITVISDNIGQTRIFRENGLGGLVLDDNAPEAIAKKLDELSGKGNVKLSLKLRNLSKEYREDRMIKIFKREFESLLEEV